MELFINNNENPPDNFIIFHNLNVLINGCYAEVGSKLYIKIGKTKQSNSKLSNLDIVQEMNEESLNIEDSLINQLVDMGFNHKMSIYALVYNNSDIDKAINWIVNQPDDFDLDSYKTKVIAHFYVKYKYTQGLYELIERCNFYKDILKISIDFTNSQDNNFNMFINIYIDKCYLYSIYQNNDIPKILLNIIDNDKLSINNEFYNIGSSIKIKTNNIGDSKIVLKSEYKRELFVYQKKNVIMMKGLEHRIKNNNGFYDTFQLKNSDIDVKYIFNIKSINENIFISNDLKMKTYLFLMI